MKRVSWLRKNHKWLALITGLQVFIWSVSGLYMVSVDLDIIHGDHLVKILPNEVIDPQTLSPISEQVLNNMEPLQSVTLSSHFGKAFYRIAFESADNKSGESIVDGQTGQIAPTLSNKRIKEITDQIYAGDASISSIKLLNEYPKELRPIKQPVWRVAFDDLANSTLYFHYQTGRLISKRSDLWRIFDFLWTLHIIEYLGFEGYTGLLFRILSILSLTMAILGSFLLYYRLKPETQQSKKQQLGKQQLGEPQ